MTTQNHLLSDFVHRNLVMNSKMTELQRLELVGEAQFLLVKDRAVREASSTPDTVPADEGDDAIAALLSLTDPATIHSSSPPHAHTSSPISEMRNGDATPSAATFSHDPDFLSALDGAGSESDHDDDVGLSMPTPKRVASSRVAVELAHDGDAWPQHDEMPIAKRLSTRTRTQVVRFEPTFDSDRQTSPKKRKSEFGAVAAKKPRLLDASAAQFTSDDALADADDDAMVGDDDDDDGSFNAADVEEIDDDRIPLPVEKRRRRRARAPQAATNNATPNAPTTPQRTHHPTALGTLGASDTIARIDSTASRHASAMLLSDLALDTSDTDGLPSDDSTHSSNNHSATTISIIRVESSVI